MYSKMQNVHEILIIFTEEILRLIMHSEDCRADSFFVNEQSKKRCDYVTQ